MAAGGEMLPDWVPDGARHYLAHTEGGRSIRHLARGTGQHASTILRQIRRIESLRDDPLVDAALTQLGAQHFSGAATAKDRRFPFMTAQGASGPPDPTEALDTEALRVLRRLCESGAVLAVAETMEKAVVVRDGVDGTSARTAVVDRPVAEAMALKGWIAGRNKGRISRYVITPAGRAAMSVLLAARENESRRARETGFADAPAGFDGAPGDWQDKTTRRNAQSGRRTRYSVPESPVVALARRKDRDGTPFVSAGQLRAGERLREDFELAQMGQAPDWDGILRGEPLAPGTDGPSQAARARVGAALDDLGPGLAEVALRCCCYLEGLEVAEKRMGWSARSGKIVLRIALIRLERHYRERPAARQMIG